MSKNSNPVVASLKAQMVSLFPALPISTGKNVPGIDVNPVSAWVRGEVPQDVAQVLKDAGFIVCSKGMYFTHNCTKMPNFPAQKPQAQKVSTPKPEKVEKAKWTELSADVKDQIVRTFEAQYPGCIVEVRGTWVFLIGGVFQTNEEYRARAKADGFHFGFKAKEWSRALTDAEIAVKAEPESKPAPAQAERTQEAVDELTELSEIVIRARKGEITREQMIALMKEACPF